MTHTRHQPELMRRLLAALVLVALLATGCGAVDDLTSAVTGPDDPVADCAETPLPAPAPGLVLAVAVHQGAPAPGLPAALQPLVMATLADGGPVQVIGVDGTPALLPAVAAAVSTSTCDAFRATLRTATAAVVDTIAAAEADSDGDDLYEAIALAAATARTMPAGTRVVVLDSGLSDRGPLDFTKPGMTRTDPSAAADYAASTSPIADVAGLIFVLTLGYTAPPQEALSGTERDNVTAVWSATLAALGADRVDVLSAPRPPTGPETTYVTTPSPVDDGSSLQPPSLEPTTVVFHEDQIRFLPDSTRLADPGAARAALAEVIAWLASDGGNAITITGTTSSAGTEAGRLRVSAARAERVRRLVLDDGADVRVGQITTEGVGIHFPQYVDDRRPDGSLDPLLAPANRTVRITARPTG